MIAAISWTVANTLRPAPVERVNATCDADTPALQAGQPLRVLSWNIQYLAGKDYVFFYDVLDGSGPDERPSRQAIARTLDEVVRVIRAERPDVLLLQEVDDGAKRTDYEDQAAVLAARLPEFRCHASAFYWKAVFVPHPRILGAVGMKLTTFSRSRIENATRHALAEMPDPLPVRLFNLKRAVLETTLPVENGAGIIVFNTHLDAFAQGNDTMQRQANQVAELVGRAAGPWLIGGDFNLLPNRAAYDRLPEHARAYYNPRTELAVLWGKVPSFPTPQQVDGPNPQAWYTHFPNDPRAKGPDRTIDYIFHSAALQVTSARIRRHDTLRISDHLPLVMEFVVPSPSTSASR